jgi:hypothetical protein
VESFLNATTLMLPTLEPELRVAVTVTLLSVVGATASQISAVPGWLFGALARLPAGTGRQRPRRQAGAGIRIDRGASDDGNSLN